MSRPENPSRLPLTVLVIEDEQRVARVIETVLGRAGHEVLLAGSLTEARRLVADEEPDVVIADFILPDGDGLAFATRLHDERGTGVVLMSGLSDLPEAAELVPLAKPFTPDQLEQAVADAAARAARPAATRP